MKKLAGRLLLFIILLGAIYSLAVQKLPGMIEAQMNTTHAPPPYYVSQAAQELHNSLLVADMHTDSLLWSRDLLQQSDIGHVDIPRLLAGNVGLQAFTIVTKSPRGQNIDDNSADTDRITDLVIASGWPLRTWNSLFERALYQMQVLHDYETASGGRLRIIKTAEEFEAFLQEHRPGEPRVAGWLGIEGAHPLEGEIENLDRLFDAGLRMAGITHFFDNELGGSMHGVEKGGLTEFGKQAVARMQELGILVDLAHASSAVIEDVLAMSKAPVVVSHTGVKGTCYNNRNLSDEQIRAIAKTGGLIAIGFWDTAVCGQDAAAIARAARHVKKLVGAKHIALGSDFDGSVVTPFDATGMAMITQALLNEGFSRYEIRLVSGLNVVRVLRETLPKS
ncbi:MAG: dipeptidase [Salinisphaeraceae bacterium]|nr:dipeptidase [Salinisphaeraceae bacterium]